jgi:iron complex transport system permease protein
MLIHPDRFRTLLLALTLTTTGLIALSMLVGRFDLAASDVLGLLWGKLSGTATMDANAAARAQAEIVLFELRIPRIAAAFVIGAALAAAGAAYQVMFRNPLVSPDILGVASGCALGAVAGIMFAWPMWLTQFAAFVGGLAAVFVVVFVGSRLHRRMHVGGATHARDPMLMLVLLGIVIGAFFATLLSLIKYVADPFNQLPSITYWMLGSFAAIRAGDVVITVLISLVAIVPLLLMRWRIDLLSVGDDEARTLGVDVSRMRLIVILSATLLTAISVAMVGMIGWIGLVIPHAARLSVGASFSRLLPIAMLLGGGFMVLVDTMSRSIIAIELPPGIITAFVGAPMFVWLLARSFSSAQKS